MPLRYYQRDAKSAVEWGWEEHRRLAMKLPTASGKTVVAAHLFRDMQPGRCLFLADQDELCQQPRTVIQRETGIIPGLEKAKDHADHRAQIVVASSQTLTRELKKGSGIHPRLDSFRRDHFDYIISDECHRGTDRDQKVWDYFETARVCGCTATPFRENLADLSKWFSAVVYEMDILDLVAEGFAPRPLILTLPVEINIQDLKIKRGFEGKDYDLESVDSIIAPYYGVIAELVRDNAGNRRGIAYLPLIKSSQAFAAALRNVGVRAFHVDGNSPDREALIQSFGAGEFDWICNSNLLSTGIDIPSADAFLNLKLTQSRAWYQQARGRIMRVLPGIIDHLPEKDQAKERQALIAASAKPNALIFDLLLQNDKLGAVQAAEDFCRNERDAKALFEKAKTLRDPQDALEISAWVQTEREAALIAALERAAIRSQMNSPLLADQVAAILAQPNLIGYISVQRWEQEPATNKQLNLLRDKGVDLTSIKSKGHASKILDAIISRVELGYASLKQVKLIKQMNEMFPQHERVARPEQLTIQEANEFITEAFKSRRRLVA